MKDYVEFAKKKKCDYESIYLAEGRWMYELICVQSD